MLSVMKNILKKLAIALSLALGVWGFLYFTSPRREIEKFSDSLVRTGQFSDSAAISFSARTASWNNRFEVGVLLHKHPHIAKAVATMEERLMVFSPREQRNIWGATLSWSLSAILQGHTARDSSAAWVYGEKLGIQVDGMSADEVQKLDQLAQAMGELYLVAAITKTPGTPDENGKVMQREFLQGYVNGKAEKIKPAINKKPIKKNTKRTKGSQ